MYLLRSNAALKTQELVAEKSHQSCPNHLRWTLVGMKNCSMLHGIPAGASLFYQAK